MEEIQKEEQEQTENLKKKIRNLEKKLADLNKLSQEQKEKNVADQATLATKEAEVKKLEEEIQKKTNKKISLLEEIRLLAEGIDKLEKEDKNTQIQDLEQELVKLRGDLKVEESEDEVVKNGLGKINYQ